MYKKLTIHKASGNYQFNNILISCISNDHYISFLNQSTFTEIGYTCLNVVNDIHNKIVYPCTDNQEKNINSFINNHTKKIDNKLYLTDIIINGAKIDKLQADKLNNINNEKLLTFHIELWQGTYPFNEIIKDFNIEAININTCIKMVDQDKKCNDYKVAIYNNDYIKADRYKNSWQLYNRKWSN